MWAWSRRFMPIIAWSTAFGFLTAVLVGPVIGAYGQELNVDLWALGEDQPVAPLGKMMGGAVENVIVFDPSPNEYMGLFIERIGRNFGWDRDGGAPFGSLWGQEHWSRRAAIDVLKIAGRIVGPMGKVDRDVHISGRCGPAVPPARFDGEAPETNHVCAGLDDIIGCKVLQKNEGPFCGNEGISASLGGLFSRIGGLFSGGDRNLHVVSLAVREISETASGEEEQNGGDRKNDGGVVQARGEMRQFGGEVYSAPIEVRLFMAISTLLGGLILSFLGWQNVDNNRLRRGVLLLAGCGVLVSGGLCLLLRL